MLWHKGPLGSMYMNSQRKCIHLQVRPLDSWLPAQQGPILIAGPCSAESEQQVLDTAIQIAKIPQVKIFRAGIWKPRTRPNCFEGVGEKALPWLTSVKKQTGLRTTVEVATASHVEACLKHGVDVLWIGARTVVNPFSVQEIADSLRGIDIPVIIKNPIVSDLDLWIGAMERINQSGVNRIIAVHRGFSNPNQKKYRYAPEWHIPLELQSLCPDLPIFCDPSHISGVRNGVPAIAQKAMSLNMHGLMVETHINPAEARSDALQQLTPAQLKEMVAELQTKTPLKDSRDFQANMNVLRKEIDTLDEVLLRTLSSRKNIVEKIGRFKAEQNVSTMQVKRWSEI